MANCLIACLGTSEPWIANESLKIWQTWEDYRGSAQAHKSLQNAHGLFEFAQTVMSTPADKRPRVYFPITERAFEYAQSPDKVILICTDDKSRSASERYKPTDDDTIKCGYWLKSQHPTWEIEPLGPHPLDPGNAESYVRLILQKITFSEFDTVYFSQSAGLPAINNECVRQLAKLSRESKGFQLKMFQVEHTDPGPLDEAHVKAGILPAPQYRLLTDYLEDVLPGLLASHSYREALQVVDRMKLPTVAAPLTLADAYWSLDLQALGWTAANPFHSQLLRANLGHYITESLLSDSEPSIVLTIEWLGDTIGIALELYKIDQLGLHADAGKNLADILRASNIQNPALDRLCDLKGARNSLVHRFANAAELANQLKKNPDPWQDQVRAALAAIRTELDSLAQKNGVPLPHPIPLKELHDQALQALKDLQALKELA